MQVVQERVNSELEDGRRIDQAVKKGQIFLYKNPNMVAIFVRDPQGVRPIGTGAAILTAEIMTAVEFDRESKDAALTKLFECAVSTGRRIDQTETSKGRSIVIGPQVTVPHYGYNNG